MRSYASFQSGTGLIDTTQFREIILGQRRDGRARLWRALFRLASIPYGWGVAYRNWRFNSGRTPIEKVPALVISVGNLTVGGTGKTPFVEWLARWFRQYEDRVVIISRGYGAEAGQRNDEALELEQKLPDVPHLQNPDRVHAARTAIEELESQVIILDDAFQHRRLDRDLDIVLLDALDPFGQGRLLPAGLLREPLRGLRRAQVVVLTRADAVAATVREAIREQARRWAPEAIWVEVAHQPSALRASDGMEQPLDALHGIPLAAFSGIGNPAGFRHSLTSCGYTLVGWREFPDHHAFTRDDIHDLERWAASLCAQALICTHKDLVKIGLLRLGRIPLWALRIGMQPQAGSEMLLEQLTRLRDQHVVTE